MRNPARGTSHLDFARYSECQHQFLQLKSHLPANAVEGLALEVIRRLQVRVRDIGVDNQSDDQIEQLCHALLAADDRAGPQFIQDVRLEGASVETV